MGSKKASIGKLPTPYLVITNTAVGGITLSWQLPRAYSGIVSYYLERGISQSWSGNIVYQGTALTATDNFTVAGGTAYTYRIRYVDSNGRYSAYSNVAGTSLQGLSWVSTDPYDLGTWQEGFAQVFDLSDPEFTSNPSNLPATYIITGGTYPPEMTLTEVGTLTIPSNVTADSYSVTVDLTEATVQPPTDALADWNSRISRPGVLWYHAFTDENEVNRYRIQGGTTFNSPDSTGGRVFHMPGGGANGWDGAVRCVRPVAGGYTYIWCRQFSPMKAWRTLPADPGVAIKEAQGYTIPAFNPTQGVDTSTYWRTGFYAPTAVQATNPGTTYFGDEFWLSFKVRISGSRATATAEHQKLWYVNDVTGSVNSFALLAGCYNTGLIFDYQGGASVYPSVPAGADSTSSRLRSPQFSPQLTGSHQTEPPHELCSYSNTAPCWRWPFDDWVTVIYHYKLAAAPETGDSTWYTYNTGTFEWGIWQPGMTGWKWIFRDNNWAWPWGWQNNDPEGFGSFLGTTYIQATLANDWYTEFAQMIFSQQAIPAPSY